MKNTNTCPKCSSTDILRLTDHSYANLIAVPFTFKGGVYLTRYVCADCGFTEQWVDEPGDRERLRGLHTPK